ncbi:MAG: bifunctional [glutamate--ammonia ligase]-adenylyl-L-tyrosine phosphorylase/[glutamate--ammonia-ligase] adenylyltransferase [Pirellulaceae bacterium]
MSTDEYLEHLANLLPLPNRHACTSFVAAMDTFYLPQDLLESFLTQLASQLPPGADADRVLNNLQRFLEASRSVQSWLTLFEREPEALQTLVLLFSTSQYMADVLIADPEAFDLLRLTGGQPIDKRVLDDEILAALSATTETRSVMRLLRYYRHRETLRIAYGDFVNEQDLETVTGQISNLAESLVEAAVWAAERDLSSRLPTPMQADGRPLGFAVIALGKLGGSELNYSSDIDLVFVSENPVHRASAPRTSTSAAHEYFQRLGQSIIKLLSQSTADGIAYRVDMRLRPHGDQGALVVTYDDALHYYDSAGRTWERQVFVKARAIAGDIELGEAFIEQLQPWIYRSYLMRADITGISALKRRLERRAASAGADDLNVKEGRGGIRDIEYVIQFLQLLEGGDEPSVRCTATLAAIRQLGKAGCLTAEEQSVLEENYRFLRRVEHYLQIMYDRQTHRLPSDESEFERLAVRIGYRSRGRISASDAFRAELSERVKLNRRILDHLLHDAFTDDTTDTHTFSPPATATLETDLILDPQPSAEVIHAVLSPYGFEDCAGAYRNLQQLAVESIRFLSTRRCRHFLSAIAPRLLRSIAETPRPDATLISLANVTESLGGKAVLWELFSASPAAMHLCVRLCACSPYLASILTSNPGMIDELLDSLMLDRIPDRETLGHELDELCRNANDIAPILHSFKNSMHLRVGVRDILGRGTIEQTHMALSDIAEACMEQVVRYEFHRLIHQLGMPTGTDGKAAEFVVLAVGKLGGREPNYHSDLDVIFLFDQEGMTEALVPNRRFEPTSNRHFFNQLSQRVVHAVTRIGNTGRLYDIDVRLRPLGRSGELAITIDDLREYFARGGGQVWERQALCKARPIWGNPNVQQAAMDCVRDVLTAEEFTGETAAQIYDHRLQLQAGANEANLKRGLGGTMDVEFVVQLLQLAGARKYPQILVPGTLDALMQLGQTGLLSEALATQLHRNYEFLRSVESGIRLMNMSARHELPTDADGCARLVFLLSSRSDGQVTIDDNLIEHCQRVRASCRELFESVFEEWLPEPAHEF